MSLAEFLGVKIPPRYITPPLRDLTQPDASWGHDCIKWAREVRKIELDDWQQLAVISMLEVLTFDEAMRRAAEEDRAQQSGTRTQQAYAALYQPRRYGLPNGKLRFSLSLTLLSRQQGKTLLSKIVIEWFLFRMRVSEMMISAQDYNHANKLFEEIRDEVDLIPALRKKQAKISNNNGNKYIKSTAGGHMRPIGVIKGAGRGATNEFLYLDELREQSSWGGWNSLSSTTIAVLNGFILATSNAGDADAVVLNEIQDKAQEAIDQGRTEHTSTFLIEWSADPVLDYRDERAWRQGNPSLGTGRLTMDSLRGEMETKSESAFRTENLCQRVDKLVDAITPVIPISEWDVFGRAQKPKFDSSSVCVEVSPVDGQTRVVVNVRTKGNGHFLSVAPFESDMSIDETVTAVKSLVDQIDPDVVVVDKKSAAHVLIEPLSRVGVETQSPDYASMLQTWTDFERYFAEGKIFHEQSQVWADELSTSKLRMDTKGQVIGFDRYFNHPQALQAAVLAVWGLTKFEVKIPTFKKVEPEERKQMILPRAVKLDRRPVWAS
ncbi:terminase large subunit [Corynebacterium glutamicum]|uniref:terminase large subunit n=1 Tax=Corynebacterium glutamicum TaxID=1718 RepID=UPI0013053F82|nr:terminase large subunit [Corynebacterium glutamicum]